MTSKTTDICIIYNPTSGQGKKTSWLFKWMLGFKTLNRYGHNTPSDLAQFIKSTVEKHGKKVTVYATEYPKHATELAKTAVIEGTDMVVAMGGDGTVHEVAQALVHTSVMLGVIPCGTANVLALAEGIPFDVKKACEVIVRGEGKPLDVGSDGQRYFITMAGVGLDAQVIHLADQEFKKTYGAKAYYYALKHCLKNKAFPRLTITDKQTHTSYKGVGVIVMNTRYYGGKFTISPQTKSDDGHFTVLVLPTRNVVSLLFLFVKARVGLCKASTSFSSGELSIQSHEPTMAHLDAEPFNASSMTLSIIPKGLRLCH